MVLLLCGHCHREQSCDLSRFPDRKKQIITQLSERMSKAVLAANGCFLPEWQIGKRSVN